MANLDGTPDTPIQLYKPWGEKRYPAGASTLPTTYRYTGQRAETGLGPSGGEGLLFFGSRWYDNQLGRFTSPDTLIPDQQNVQSWDRFAYSFNNPINYVDPSGHTPWYISGWKDEYLQTQEGNTCAPTSLAVGLSILMGGKVTLGEIRPFFGTSTYLGRGITPEEQAFVADKFDPRVSATFSQGSRADLLDN